ncbi:MAG: hypothetical protein HY288_20195 [Planctomycetia bacterium]|nr:hypothetical protein [Planctomycetia bacterium]
MPTNPNIPPNTQQPAAAVRAILSVLIILHVLAVFIGPWAMPPQSSELAASCARLFQPYLESLGLANGYRFFAPEPGPSHLVRYEVTLPDGSQQQGVFPDRRQHKPRLLYHRYFMLSEFINTLENPNAPRDRAEAYAKSYAQHLAHLHQATQVKLYLRRHFVPRMSEVRQGMRLADKALYEEHPLGTFSERDEP